MKNILLLSLLALTFSATAQETLVYNPNELSADNPSLQPLEPSFMHDYVQLGKAGQHWFVGGQGGASAFIGNPTGCGDLFDRIMPTWNAYVGKWVTPGFGVRLALQGSRYKTAELETTSFMIGHADMMWNLAETFRKPTDRLPRWDFAIYAGTGLVRGANLITEKGYDRNFMFAATYGVYTRFRLNRWLFLSGELGGFTTFRNFDGEGEVDKLGDNMPSASLGIGFNIGSQRWRRAIEANDFINQNDKLLDYIYRLNTTNEDLVKVHNMDQKTIREFRKIIEIEGLMDKYASFFAADSTSDKNSYPGLLALKARIELMQSNGSRQKKNETPTQQASPSVIDVPIYFFFQLGKAVLSEDAQLINLDEIARVAKQHNLKIRIASAADSATGTEANNENLSIARAKYITQQLKLRGVKESDIQEIALGGIAEYENPKYNRYSRVSLYLEI